MKVTWLDVHKTVNRMALYLEQVHSMNRLFGHTIVGISRGGLVPAVMLSNRFEDLPFQIVQVQRYHGEKMQWKTFKEIVKDATYHLNKGPYIFIDDICDEGLTFRALDLAKSDEDNLYCCLVWRNNERSQFKPNYAGMTIDSKEWVVFPWEKTQS